MSDNHQLSLEGHDRVLILAAHPDDETLGTGGVIQKALALRLPVRLVYLTHGDNAETAFIVYRRRLSVGQQAQQMGMVRSGEALHAAAELGLDPADVTFLGYPDFRTLVMWTQHWGGAAPCMSMFTRTDKVPYPNAMRPGAPYRADEILADIVHVLREFKPTKVFVSHPADHNPDHLSLYLFTRVALWNLQAELQPALFPVLTHHPAWPTPAGFNPQLSLDPPERLEKDATWWKSPLSAEEIERKLSALRKHETQCRMSASYLESFVRSNELFGDLAERVLPLGGQAATAAPQTVAAAEMADQLTNAERAKWVGVEQRSLWQEGDCVAISVRFSRPLAGESVGAAIYLFGYRHDRPFNQMPKVQVRLSQSGYSVLDQDRRLPASAVELQRGNKGFLLRVPLRTLGDPQRIMGSARTYARRVPLDWIAWRVVAVNAGH
jgi:LmbE family N-acetylglucosaminyl deacetylase